MAPSILQHNVLILHKIATSPLYHRINQSGHLLIVYIKLIDDVGSDNEKNLVTLMNTSMILRYAVVSLL